MKLQKIEIEQFGGLKNFVLDFSDGPQYIYGLNEAGKSTLCAFIATMFYGFLPKEKKNGLRGDGRSLYMPWGETYMAGILFFEAEGTEYVLKRRFGQTARGDKISLMTAQDWQEVSVDPKDIGQRFLGVGQEAFYKTLFVSQLGAVFEKGKEDELMGRLSNLEQTGDEDTSLQKALTELERAQYELITKTGRGGEIAKIDAEIEELKAEIFEVQERHSSFRSLLADIRRMIADKESASKQLEETEKKRQKAIAFSEYQKYCELVSEKKKAADKMKQLAETLAAKQKALEGLQKEKEAFSSVLSMEETVISDLAEKEAACGVLKKRLADAEALEQEISALKDEIRQKQEKHKKAQIPLLCMMGFFALVTVLFAFFLSPLFLFVTMAFVVGSFWGMKNGGKNEVITLSAKLSEKEETLAELMQENLAEKLSVLETEIQTVFKIAQAENLSELNKKIAGGKNCTYQIREAEQEIKRMQSEMQALEIALNAMPEPEEKPEIQYEGPTAEQLEEKRRSLETEQLERERSLARMQAKVENGFSGMRSIAEIEGELESAQEKRAQMLETYEAITLAKEVLSECAGEMKNIFAPVLNQKSGELIEALTGGRYREIKVTDDYKIMLRTPEGTDIVPAEFVSAGTYDLLYFALRMAVLQTLFEEMPLIILDDAFIQLDEKRQEKAFAWLLSQESQALYFSCHQPPKAWSGPIITL